MVEAQTLEIKTLDEYKLGSFVKRVTGRSIFPYFNQIAEIAEFDQGLLEALIGAVSIVNRAGKLGKEVNYETFDYLSDSLPNEKLNSFLKAIYNKANGEKSS